jgi:hypothetical protein
MSWFLNKYSNMHGAKVEIVTIREQFVGIACLMKDIFETIRLYLILHIMILKQFCGQECKFCCIGEIVCIILDRQDKTDHRVCSVHCSDDNC